MHRLVLIPVLALLASAAGGAPSAVLAQARGGASKPAQDNSEVANATLLMDVVGRWTGPKPAPKAQVGWADTGGFDMQLHESLAARLARIDVRVNGAYGARVVPERMGQWLDQVRRRGGSVRTCVVNQGARGILGHITLVVGAVQDVAAWQLYQPATDYSALVVVTPDDRLVRNILFVRDERSPGCPPGTDAAGS
jgi:hypothetical protein